ncbi:MAG: dihydrofolate reductase family protein [Pseudomonadota bacterium]
MKTVYYLASSLDGYIADSSGGVGWLDEASIDHQNTGYETFYAGVDALLMGRSTWDFVENYGQWPYDSKPAWVCTSRAITGLEGCNLQAGRDPATALAEARAMGVGTLWVVGGGLLASSLLQMEALTHISVSVMPVVLGNGIKLFATLPGHVHLRQESAVAGAGFTQIEYSVAQGRPGQVAP